MLYFKQFKGLANSDVPANFQCYANKKNKEKRNYG